MALNSSDVYVSDVEYAPLIDDGSRSGGRSFYPWEKLKAPITKAEDGQVIYPSFFVAGKTKKQFAAITYAAAKRLGFRIRMRWVEQECDDGVVREGLRIYRVGDKTETNVTPKNT